MISAKPMAMVAMLALAGGVVAYLLALPDPDPPRSVSQERTDLPGGADAALASSAEAVGAAETDQQATDPSTEALQRGPLHEAARIVITGRVVASETGLPLSGCEVVLIRFQWEPGGDVIRRIEVTRARSGVRPAPAFSRADGRFELLLDEMVAPPHLLRIKPPDRGFREEASFAVRGPLRPGETLDLGDLAIALRQDERVMQTRRVPS